MEWWWNLCTRQECFDSDTSLRIVQNHHHQHRRRTKWWWRQSKQQMACNQVLATTTSRRAPLYTVENSSSSTQYCHHIATRECLYTAAGCWYSGCLQLLFLLYEFYNEPCNLYILCSSITWKYGSTLLLLVHRPLFNWWALFGARAWWLKHKSLPRPYLHFILLSNYSNNTEYVATCKSLNTPTINHVPYFLPTCNYALSYSCTVTALPRNPRAGRCLWLKFTNPCNPLQMQIHLASSEREKGRERVMGMELEEKYFAGCPYSYVTVGLLMQSTSSTLRQPLCHPPRGAITRHI